MTNYINGLVPTEKEKNEPKKTVFKMFVRPNGEHRAPLFQPSDFTYVRLIFKTKKYGDVFAAWDNHSTEISLYFGEAGDEFGDI